MVAFVLASCLKEPNPELIQPSQLFRPISFTSNVNVVTVSLNWVPIKNASYLLEVSRDSFQFERDLVSIPVEQQANFVLEDLRSQSRYSARIKAVSKEQGVKDSEYQMITFVTGLENLFYQPDPARISATSVELGWEPGKAVTRIDVLSGQDVIKQFPLTEEQVSLGSVLVDGLSADTPYSFRIYNGEILRGTITARTLPESM